MAEQFIEGHIAVLPGEEFSPTEGRIGVFFDPQDLQETLESKRVPKGTMIKTIVVPADTIIRANSKRFTYRPNPEARLLSGGALSCVLRKTVEHLFGLFFL